MIVILDHVHHFPISHSLNNRPLRRFFFIKKMNEIDSDEILQAVDNYNIDFYKEDELEKEF